MLDNSTVPTTLTLREGIDKNGKPWYQAIIGIGDYESEALFISKLEYRELVRVNEILKAQNSKIDLDQE